MAIIFNPGDKVTVDQTFVQDVLAKRTPSTERKALVEHLGRLGSRDLCVSRVYNYPLIRVTVIGSLASQQSPSLMFESESDLNNSFTLVKKFTPQAKTVQAKNGDDVAIGPGQFVCLIAYEGSDPEIPVITAPDQKSLATMPVFGITTSLIPPGLSGSVLIQGYYSGLNTEGTTLQDACYVGMNGTVIETVPGSNYRETAIVLDPSINGLIYLPKQPGGPYTCFEASSYTGDGNNKNEMTRGQTHSNLSRLGKASYPNGKSLMPKKPNARTISNNVCAQSADNPNESNVTDYLWVWGQFIDHDIAKVEAASPIESSNITIPTGDPIFPPGELPFKRSTYDSSTGVTDVRQQVNSLSSYLDGSMVYGSDSARANALRANDGSGKMDTSDGGEYLPKNTRMYSNEPSSSDSQYYFAGDVRANEQLVLLAMHTLWVREHNRIATSVKLKNPALTGDQIYFIARRKVVALIQHITFNEFLPTLLGPLPAYTGYDSSVDPSIHNEFTAGLYRLGHTMVSERLQRLDANLNTISEGWCSLKDAFFRPDKLKEGGSLDPLLRGAAKQVCQKIDTKVVDGLRNFLFGNPGAGGLDLAAINIQRGRDHGLPSYNETRKALNLAAKRSFSEITSDTAVITSLSTTYNGINEIDLWIGMLAEDHVEGALVGETLQIGLKKQFLAIRDGDRFWYENVYAGSLLQEIKDTKLSHIIKRNTDIGSELQEDVFFLTS